MVGAGAPTIFLCAVGLIGELPAYSSQTREGVSRDSGAALGKREGSFGWACASSSLIVTGSPRM